MRERELSLSILTVKCHCIVKPLYLQAKRRMPKVKDYFHSLYHKWEPQKKRSLMPMPSVTWIELLLGHRLKNEIKRLTLNDIKISSGLADVFRGSGVGSVWIWSFSPNVMQLCHFAAVHCVIVAGVSWPMSSLFHFMLWLRWMHFFWKLKCHGESSFITLNNNKVGLETEDKKKCFY